MALIGAILTPTDPVLAGSIVSGRLAESRLPSALRALISGESGTNDGLGFLFVMLPLLMFGRSPGEALRHWLVKTLFGEVLAAVVAGLVLGSMVGWVLRVAKKRGITSETSILTVGLALAFVVVSSVKLMGSDGILAVFSGTSRPGWC